MASKETYGSVNSFCCDHAIKQSEAVECYRAVFTTAFHPILLVDAGTGMILDANAAVCRTYGYSLEEIKLLSLMHLSSDPDRTFRELVEQLPRTSVDQHKHSEGSLFPITGEMSYYNIGERNVAVVTVRDISMRLSEKKAYNESEARYRGIVESQKDVIIRYNLNGILTFANEAASKVVGIPSDQIIGCQIINFVHPDHREKILDKIHDLMEYPHRKSSDVLVKTPNGWRWFSFESCLILDNSGSPIECQSVGRDVHDLTSSLEELQRAYQTQKEFLNCVTHEVRTPLIAVQGYSEMLIDGMAGPLNEDQIEYLQRIITSSNVLLDTVNGLLEITRLRTGRTAITPALFDPVALVNKVVATVAPQIHRKGLSISIENKCRTGNWFSDASKLAVIMSNLLSNAVKFTDKGGIEIIIEVCEDNLEIVVVDSGKGMQEKDLLTIFDEFHQLAAVGKHKSAGFGLGLAVIAEMVELLQGAVYVSSRSGIGTAFMVVIPTLTVYT